MQKKKPNKACKLRKRNRRVYTLIKKYTLYAYTFCWTFLFFTVVIQRQTHARVYRAYVYLFHAHERLLTRFHELAKLRKRFIATRTHTHTLYVYTCTNEIPNSFACKWVLLLYSLESCWAIGGGRGLQTIAANTKRD